MVHRRKTVNNHMAKKKFNQNYQNIVHRRKQVVVTEHPENQTIFNKLTVVPDQPSYKDAAVG